MQAELARHLVQQAFPRWKHLPVRAVEVQGHNNWTFRLGDTMSLRFPRDQAYAGHVPIEFEHLPKLASHLPLPIPTPLALAEPSTEFPLPWMVLRWIPGETAARADRSSKDGVATGLVEFLQALRRCPTDHGPKPGAVNFHRGAGLEHYDGDTRRYAELLREQVPLGPVLHLWEQALAVPYRGPAVWLHGDLAPTNLLVDANGLCGVIDWGQCAVGDPACDLTITWTWLEGDCRVRFQRAMGLDKTVWLRARAWALWKALFLLHDPQPGRAETPDDLLRLIGELLEG